MKHSTAAVVETVLAILLAGAVLVLIFLVHRHQHGVALP